MKITQQVETAACDFCEAVVNVDYECVGCGKDICRHCQPSKLVVYPGAVHIRDSGCGVYCRDCDAKLTDDRLHQAYVHIETLQQEWREFADAFIGRTKAAEAERAAAMREADQ
jgi:hypothetical protein